MFDLADERFRSEDFAVFVLSQIVTFSAAPGMFEKRIGGKSDPLTYAAADEIAYGLTDGFSDQVKAAHFESSIRSGCLIERILTGNKVGLGAIDSGAFAFNH
jgi:hypothetical protein